MNFQSILDSSHQDCRATMYDCLRYVLATSHDEQCTSACDNNLIYCKHPTDITEHPEYNFYDEVRRINITCHRELTACLQNNANAKFEVIRKTDLCLQAIAMAVNRIRTKEYAPVTSYPNNPTIQAIFWPFIKFFKIDV
ncbi:hypothetical protein PRIPAC_91522 [Pristionchus pacificus]|uniref:Uncharacterized protein n=1 Tax=Pristionchus pacificus TaxID=54126 RepID=A0A2A6BAN0_PRIPA|nr:hypothetical protein PRIPAC_91522 [Pristionchus pacificus]|eukprot:PDM62928.1 hypothetical protein PRIPAC_50143 [Pristionchus pacificus]